MPHPPGHPEGVYNPFRQIGRDDGIAEEPVHYRAHQQIHGKVHVNVGTQLSPLDGSRYKPADLSTPGRIEASFQSCAERGISGGVPDYARPKFGSQPGTPLLRNMPEQLNKIGSRVTGIE